MRRLGPLLAGLTLLACCAAPATAATFKVTPAHDFNAYFTRCGPGWNGGDSGFSFVLGGPLAGKVAWLWSDTYLGPVSADGTADGRRDLTVAGIPPFIRNSITLQPSTGAPPTTAGDEDFVTLHDARVGETAKRISSFPRAPFRFAERCRDPQVMYRSLVRPSDDEVREQYWAGDGAVDAAGRLTVVLRRTAWYGPRMLDVDWVANDVATFSPTPEGSLRLDSVTPAPTSKRLEIQWGAAVVRDGGFLYVYGIRESRKAHTNVLYVARVPDGALADASAWRFWNGRDFSRRQNAVASIGRGVDHEFTVLRAGPRRFVLVSVDKTDGVNKMRNIRRWIARSPTGRFSRREVVYRMPEATRPGRRYAYAAHVHPQFTRDDRWLVSYSVHLGEHFKRVDAYRPRFVRVKGLTR